MKIIVKELTPLSSIDRACSFTAGKDVKIKDYGKMFKSGHSVIRAYENGIQSRKRRRHNGI